MKPVDVKSSTYLDSDKENNKEDNKEDPKFEVADHVGISKYKNIFAKSYTPNTSEEVFVVKKVKNTVLWTQVISDFNGQGIIEMFYKRILQNTNQDQFRVEKVIKRKDDKAYVK